MTPTTLLAYALALSVAAAIPGPGITAIVGRALSMGAANAFAMGLGLITGDSLYLTAVVFGLAVLAQSFGTVFLILKYLGVAYLIYIAWKIWTAGIIGADQPEAPRQSFWRSYLSGLLITLGNPKVMLFYVALLPSLVPLSQLTRIDFVLLLATTIGVLLAVLSPYILLASRARQFFHRPQALKALNRGAASILVATACWIAAKA